MMGNRFNIPVPPVRCLSYGETQEARSAADWKWQSKPLVGLGRQIPLGINHERLWIAGGDSGELTDATLTGNIFYASRIGDRI